MATTTHHRRSANEKNIDELHADTHYWDEKFHFHSEEVSFLKSLLTAPVFKGNIPNMYEKLQEFYNELIDLKEEKMELHEAMRNHKNDLNGMMECEDISCETFYHSQHQKLAYRIQEHLDKFKQLKLEIYRFSTPLLKADNPENLS
ncbi:hypothetical protein FK178_02015 [Antarcticibacterium arcticum]|uniref:Hemerythrin-like domain-containing protein n=1 Tax=Antarcticibacterium arcticum TaxID=2585771 RepID=A0A5B8YIW7_9FLAO|nr:hypothetical protein [Antarcticibacterium arcticum]QED36563.1 hypothetical protein FK178_02015 [Antarcticibacterium arcticum]